MSQPLRVLLLIRELEVGGAQTTVLNLATALARLSCQPIVCPWRYVGPLEARFRAAGIPIESLGDDLSGWRRLGVPRALARLVARLDIDVVHAHMSDSALWAALVQSRTGVPGVITHHTNDLIDLAGVGRPVYGWARRKLLAYSARRVALNIAVSDSVRERLIAATGLDDRHAVTILNGIPVADADTIGAARAARAASVGVSGNARLVFVGRLHESKDVATLLSALAALRASHGGATLTVVGDGDTLDGLRAQAADLNLSEAVTFAGFQTDIGAFLAEADLFVSASRLEGLPIAVLEAMARGVPVIATDIPGHQEIVHPGATGRLVPVGDPTAIAEAARAALADWDETERLASAAVDMMRETYSAEHMAARHLDAYRALLPAPT